MSIIHNVANFNIPTAIPYYLYEKNWAEMWVSLCEFASR